METFFFQFTDVTIGVYNEMIHLRIVFYASTGETSLRYFGARTCWLGRRLVSLTLLINSPVLWMRVRISVGRRVGHMGRGWWRVSNISGFVRRRRLTVYNGIDHILWRRSRHHHTRWRGTHSYFTRHDNFTTSHRHCFTHRKDFYLHFLTDLF